jgi:hypothetical protein
MRSASHTFASLAAIGFLALGSQHVAAGSVTCPSSTAPDYGTVTTTEADFTTVDSLNPTCVGSGEGGKTEYEAFLGADYELLAKEEEGAYEGIVGALDVTGINFNSGQYQIDYSLLSSFTNFVFILKRGEGNIVNDWIIFDLDGSEQGLWELIPSDSQALSHAAIYGTVVPIPAAAWLFGSALVGLAGIGFRRRSAAA